VLDRAAADRIRTTGCHVSFPSFGFAVRDGSEGHRSGPSNRMI
jgi:hypothetical protein